MINKYFFYIAIPAVLLIAWYISDNIKDRIDQELKNAKMASPYVDDRIEGQIKSAMEG